MNKFIKVYEPTPKPIVKTLIGRKTKGEKSPKQQGAN